jgi:hypothetical protein
MTKLTFKQFLQEAPLHDYQTIGNFDKGASFRDARDRRIIQHPKAIERVRKKFGNTSYDFDFYFVNTKEAKNHTEVGLVNPEWVKTNLGDEVYAAIEKNLNQDHIQVIFTNNSGAERVPLTAWMMAHRLGHALARKNSMKESRSQYMNTSNHLINQMSQIMQYYGKNEFPDSEGKLTDRGYNDRSGARKNELTMLFFFQTVCTFKSARDKNIRDWFEVLNELIAQYLTTGKIKFNPAPKTFGGGAFGNKQQFYCQDQQEVNDILEMLARDMGFMIDDILSTVVNGVLVM